MGFRRIYIEITNACNLACSFCSSSNRSLHFMSKKEFEHILKEIASYTNVICLHVKGEPLLHPDLKDILALCDKYQVKVSLTTNGTLLKEKVMLLNETEAIEKIHISLNCETDKNNYYQQVFESVSQLSSSKIVVFRLWALQKGVLDKKSTKAVEKIASFYHLSPTIVDNIKENKNTKISFNRYVDKDSLFTWPTIGEVHSDGFCQGLKSQLAILSDGTVVPCCLDGEGIINLGNIFEVSLATILSSKRACDIITSFEKNKACEVLCQSCTFKYRFK